MTPGRITVRYSCSLCGLVETQADVKARTEPQGVLEWFEGMLVELCQHHALASPGCSPKELQGIMVPIDKDGKVGIGFPVPKP